MTRLWSSTAFRLAIFYSLAFATVTFSLGIAIYWALRSELGYELDQRILAERSALIREAGRGNIAAFANAVRSRAAHGNEDMRYAILDARGVTLAGSRVAGRPKDGWGEVDIEDGKGELDEARVFASPIDGGRLVVGADPESVERLDQRMIPLFAMAFGLMALVGIVGSFILSVALRKRVEAITKAAEAIIRGDIDRRMPVNGSQDEFDRLSATLNTMLDRIGELLVNLHQVSDDIAHDLRTPLSRLRQKLESALHGEASVEAMRDALHDVIEHTDDMLVLFTAILSISEVEAGTLPLTGRSFDLSALVTDLADSYDPAAEDAGRTIVRAIEPNIEIEGSRELVAQLMVNLLDNALRHTSSGVTISMSLKDSGARAELTIADDGPGIPRGQRSHVFKRFTRLEHGRSTPGHGLGLSLVAAIAAAHKATLALEDNRPGVKMVIGFKRSGG